MVARNPLVRTQPITVVNPESEEVVKIKEEERPKIKTFEPIKEAVVEPEDPDVPFWNDMVAALGYDPLNHQHSNYDEFYDASRRNLDAREALRKIAEG